MEKVKLRISQYLAGGNILEDLFLSYTVSFLAIIDYSFYRQIKGIPFIELRPSITENYIKFLIPFLLLGLFLYIFFCVVIKRSDLLDLILLCGGVISALLIAGFSPQSFSFCLILFIFMGLLTYYFYGYKGRNPFGFEKSAGWILGAFVVIYLIVVTIFCVLQHRIFKSYDLDLGYFDQVFYSLSKTLKPTFTLFGHAINHFKNNHFSPILYLLLPGYLLYQSAEYLIFIQAVFIGLAVIPLYKLGTVYHLEKKTILFLCISFLLQPGILGGLFYDFHEYALLPFFIFWLLYFVEIRKKGGILVFLLLTLMIKEDAVIYVIAIGLFELVRKNGSKKNALILIFSSIIYFLLVSNLILDTTFFHNRYDNLINDESNGSYFDILKVFFTNPLYLFTQCFTSDKLIFSGMILLPLSLIPLTGLFHISEAFLFLPMIAINLLPSWQAQYSINFQYNFGTIPLFIFICIRFLSSIQNIRKRNMLAALVLVSTLIFSTSFHSEKYSFAVIYKEKQPEFQAIHQSMQKIPETASVSAASHFVPHLSERDEIYTFGVKNDTDYILVDLRGGGTYVGDTYNEVSYLSEIKRLLSEENYGVVDYWENWYALLEKDYTGELDEKVSDFLETGIEDLRE